MPSAPPQTSILRRLVLLASAGLLAVGLYRIGKGFFVQGTLRFGNPVSAVRPSDDMPEGDDPEPRRVRAEVTRVRGNQLARPYDHCEFLVRRRALQGGAYECRADVVCGGKVVYGGSPERGFFACKLYEEPRRDVVGTDPSTTQDDRDPALFLDTRAGVLRVWDDARGKEGAFEIEADVIDVE